MKKLLFVLVIAVIAYFSFELLQDRDPLAPVRDIVTAYTTQPPPVPVPATALAPNAAPTIQAAAPLNENTIVLGAPPRDSAEEGNKRFGPIAAFLSQVIGRKVVYKHPITWGGYQADMQNGAYDLLFDGPHFVSWRIENLRHNALVKLPGEPLYVVGFVRSDNTRVRNIQQLVGQSVCAHAPPNLGTLTLLRAFDNPSRQPMVVTTEGFGKIYTGVLEGKCVAGIVPKKNLLMKDKVAKSTRVIFEHSPFPEQALTAGPRLSIDEQAEIAVALMSSAVQAAFPDFREAYALNGSFVRARNSEYAGFGSYLKPVQGFSR